MSGLGWRCRVVLGAIVGMCFCLLLGCLVQEKGKEMAPPQKQTAEPPPAQKVTAGQELPPMSSKGKPGIASVLPNRTTVPRCEKFELTVDLSASYDNPFDPDQVDLAAEFASPSGKKIGVSGFFYQPYRDRNKGDDKKSPLLDADGPPCWKVRFAPTEEGAYSYALTLRNRFGDVAGEAKWGPGKFECVPSKNHGFIRVSPRNYRYFQFDDGTPFFAVGQNLQNDWPCYFHSRLLAESGCNAARVWTFCHWTWLEWTIKADGFPSWAREGHWMRSYAGAGRYNQRIAWAADRHLDQWTRDGLWLMLCLGNATGNGEVSLSGKDRYDSWGGSPYNAANGGPLDEPRKFWTDERARKLYKQRLRYIVARYGYSPNVWAWELWNELGEATPEIAAWHKEMADYLHEIDPNHHLVTTSTWQGNMDKFAAAWDLKEMDFTQCHHYGVLPALAPRVAGHLARWPKPHVVGEGGGPAPSPNADDLHERDACVVDPDGVEFHGSLWASAMSGAAGTTLPWWWRQRVEPRNLFYHYRAVANFVQDIPWNDARLRPIPAPVVLLVGGAPRKLSPTLIAPLGADWGSKPKCNRFRIEPDGSLVPGMVDLRGELFGSARGRSEWRNPVTFEMDLPEPGRFIVHVSTVMHGALEIRLDGKSVLRDDFPQIAGKKAERDVAVDVPAGRHEVTLDNVGADLVRFGYIVLTNHRDSARYPDVDVFGLQSDDFAALWIHNRLCQWAFQAAGIAPEPVGPTRMTLDGLQDGAYQVEWWDTYKGEITKTEDAESRNGKLDLNIPAIATDVACKIKRVPK